MSIADDVSGELAGALKAAGLDTVEGAFAYESGEDLDNWLRLAHRPIRRPPANAPDAD